MNQISELKDMSITSWIKAAVWVSRAVRKLGGSKLVTQGKHYITLQTLLPLHLQATHAMRKLALDLQCEGKDTEVRSSREAMAVCTALRDAMANLLDLDEHGLHCSIKVFIQGDRVVTWARSSPLDDRPHEMRDNGGRSLTDGSPWCSLLGCDDGITRWRKHKCFVCNDLPSADAKNLLVCKREQWQRYYKSALVYPLLYRKDADEPETVVFGFLSFDSPRINAFTGLPDIFAYREDNSWSQYHQLLGGAAPFHLGAIMADTLSVFLRPFYESNRTKVLPIVSDAVTKDI